MQAAADAAAPVDGAAAAPVEEDKGAASSSTPVAAAVTEGFAKPRANTIEVATEATLEQLANINSGCCIVLLRCVARLSTELDFVFIAPVLPLARSPRCACSLCCSVWLATILRTSDFFLDFSLEYARTAAS